MKNRNHNFIYFLKSYTPSTLRHVIAGIFYLLYFSLRPLLLEYLKSFQIHGKLGDIYRAKTDIPSDPKKAINFVNRL